MSAPQIHRYLIWRGSDYEGDASARHGAQPGRRAPPEKFWRRGHDAMEQPPRPGIQRKPLTDAASMSDPAQQFRLNQQMARFLHDQNDDA